MKSIFILVGRFVCQLYDEAIAEGDFFGLKNICYGTMANGQWFSLLMSLGLDSTPIHEEHVFGEFQAEKVASSSHKRSIRTEVGQSWFGREFVLAREPSSFG